MTTPNYELLKTAYAILDGIPKNRIDLGSILKNVNLELIESPANNCGTIGCALGWLSLHPMFNDLGLYPWNCGISVGLTYGGKKYQPSEYEIPAAAIFGLERSDARGLFASRYEQSGYDASYEGPDKGRFQHRVKAFLRKHGQL